MCARIKGHSEGWTPEQIKGRARYSASDIVALVDWYQVVVPGPGSGFIVASGNLPSRVAVNRAPVSKSPGLTAIERALVAYAAGDRKPPFTWSRALHFYVDATGLLVPWELVRAARDKVVARVSRDIREVTLKMAAGEETISRWQNSVADLVKQGHGALASIALGGWSSMVSEDWDIVSEEVSYQFGYLEQFASELEGEYLVDGRLYSRAEQYGRSSRKSWFAAMTRSLSGLGYDEERNLLTFGENCDECLEMTALGWVPVGVLIDIGSRTCRGYCACELEYRSGFTGEKWDDTGE